MYLNLHGNFPGLRSHYILLVAVAIGVAVPVLAMSLRAAIPQIESTLARSGDVGFGKLPLSFEPNLGQTSDQVRYLVHAKGGTFFFTSSEVVLSLAAVEQEAYKTITGLETDVAPKAIDSHIVRVRFDGANRSPDIEAGEALPGKVNYLIGSEPSKWRTNLATYEGVTYKELYPGISLSYEGTEGLLKGTYRVAPGADPATIRWRYEGASSARINSEGDLIISGEDAAMSLIERAPVAWQEIDGKRVPVQARYSTGQDGSIGFALGNYDKAYPLTIDPTLTYSTYLGGSGQDEGYGIDLDAVGNMYIVGLTQSTNFPTVNAYQPTYQGGTDAFVTKMNPEGTALIYSTYLGGSGLDQGFAIAVDGMGRATITGNTNSTNFPVENPYQPNYGGGVVDSFATQLGVTGAVLVYSTYLGGSGFDTGQGVALDDMGSAYIAGLSNSTNFPVVNAYQPSNAGGQDVTVTKLSPNVGAPGYSTYLGGSGDDFGRAIAVDGTRNAYLTGSTISNNFPVMNAYQPTCRNNCAYDDSFVTKFNAAGTALLYSTYIGGNIQETGYGIAVDSAGNAYSTGTTSSLNYPTRNPFQPNFVNFIDAYVTKIDTTLSGDASLIYSTYLGGNSTDYGYDIVVDSLARAYVTGYANSTNFPLLDPLQQGNAGGADAFVTVFAPSGSSLVFSTQLGGDMNDFGRGIAVDGGGTMHVAGMSESTNFPLVNPYQPNNAGGPRDVVVFKIANPPPATATPPPPTATSTATAAPPTATFTPTPTPAACGTASNYVITQSTGATIVPGTVDIGNHCDDCNTTISLPFTYYLYGQPFDTANVSSNGNLQFVSNSTEFTNRCLPATGFNYAIMPYWDDLRTDEGGCEGGACGIYTSVSGTAPNRIFNIEWRTYYFFEGTAHFELRLYESSPEGRFDVIYATLSYGNNSATSGVQGSTLSFTQYFCNGIGGNAPPGRMVTYTQPICASATPTATANTPTATSTTPPTDTSTPTTTRTNTPIVPTATSAPSSTATPCTLNFNDVPQGHTFYASIRCLVCLGIISGYADGTFRPNNQVTRGQLAKMVSNAAGFNEAVSGQTFTDVPPTHTFYEFIERLTIRGYMTGYVCGGPGEPCINNMPYFRPQANATRGQTSKIVANAAGFIEPPVGQTFQDVPPTHTFYAEIQRLASRNVMQGYACGGPFEPCVEPENRPYFRPGNDVTRGQSAKIVANAFFPGCVTP